jgi:hypothetical protein
MGMTKMGSGIVLVGYSDAAAGVVYCRSCGDDGDGVWMDSVYSTDATDDTPPCFSCGVPLAETVED